MYRNSKNKLVKRIGVSTVVATGILATGVGIAGASGRSAHEVSGAKTSTSTVPLAHTSAEGSRSSSAPGMMRGLGGSITALSASSITVQDGRGTSSSYTIDSSTKVTKDRMAATYADLAVGEHVRIIASTTSPTTAAGVEIELARVAGQVVSVSANSITVSDRDGFYRTISVGSSTSYTKSGASAALSDVATGSFVMAEGTVDANHTTLDASSVGIGLPTARDTPGMGGPSGTDPQGMGGPGMAGGFSPVDGGIH